MAEEKSDSRPGAGTDGAPPESPVEQSRNAPGPIAWMRDLVFSVLIAVIMIVFIYQPVKVEGTSMRPALDNDERIFVNKFTYRLGLQDIERGDTVVFWFPGDPTKSYIKRVIGVPGDRVRIEAGQVYLNSRPLMEGYVTERDGFSWPVETGATDQIVPAGKYFVLGDNRASSSDSRTWGFVPRDKIYGKAVFAYWPPSRIGLLH